MKTDLKLVKNGCAWLVTVLWLAFAGIAGAQVNVLTWHNDNARTGQNVNETVLTPKNVNAATFQKLFAYAVDGYVYAQPLYVSNVTIPGKGVHNVVYVATEHNSVYAFDADNPAAPTGGLLWSVSLGVSAVTPNNDFGNRYGPYSDINPEVGITGTPVIDPATGTLYVDAFTHEGTAYYHRLHALDITTGAEKFGGPVLVAASIPGTGDGNVGGVLTFSAKQENQRSALTFSNGVLYVNYAGYADTDPYHGWVLAYSGSNLQLLSAFCTTPKGSEAGVWMSGGGLAVDAAKNLYCSTGNGTFDANLGGPNYGDSILKLSLSGTLAVADSFTPFNQADLAARDVDLGSGGVVLLPDQPGSFPHLMVTCGKEGKIYLINRDNLGGYSASADQVVQSIPNALPGSFDTPAYFNNRIYYGGVNDVLKAFSLVNGRLSTTPVATGNIAFDFPGSSPSISASGTNNGIVWALRASTSGILYAYDATNLNPLYNSSQAGARDQLPGGVKFTVPSVANGKVYVGSQYAVSVFGLPSYGPLPAPWADADVGSVGIPGLASYNSGTSTFTVEGSGADIWNTADAFHFAYQQQTGNFQVIARVAAVQNTNSWAKAGVMIRETLDASSSFVDTFLTPGNGAGFQARNGTGANATHIQGANVTAPYWVKLTRSGNVFTSAISPDGNTWTPLGSTTVAMASTVYVGLAVTAHDNTLINTSAFDNVNAIIPPTPPVGTGTGLVGNYFTGQTLTNLTLMRTDPTVNFNWGSGSPDPSLPVDHFSVRWAGQVQAQYSETYTFFTESDDGVRLWVNGQKLIDNWTDHGQTENSGSIALARGQKYDITLEYYESTGLAVCELLWSSASQNKQVIPQTQLYPSTSLPNQPPVAVNDTAATNESTSVTINVLANDSDPDHGPQPLTVISVGPAANGAASLVAGQVSYLPNPGFYGVDSFVYTISDGAATASATVTVTVNNTALAMNLTGFGLSGTNYGVGSTGSSRVLANSSWELNSASSGYWGTSDNLHFEGQMQGGDFQIIAKMNSLACTNLNARAGLMIRESSAPDARCVTLSVTTGNQYRYSVRAATGAASTETSVADTYVFPNAWLILQRTGDTITIAESSDDITYNHVATVTLSGLAPTLDVGLFCTSGAIGVNARAVVTNYQVIPFSQLPSPWTDADIGSVGIPGLASYNSSTSTFTVKGSGADIWFNADAFHYAYQQLTGDFQITARVTAEQNTNSWAKAGVMIRETLAAGSSFAATLLTPGNGSALQVRNGTGTSAIHGQGPNVAAPYWVKLTRAGNVFTSAVSPDGNTWTTIGTNTVPMAATVYVGLAVTSHDNTLLNTSTFDNVSLLTPPPPLPLPSPWTHADVGSVGLSGTASYAANGTFTVKGSGADIWYASDAFHYAYQQQTGDFHITARVTSEQNTNSWAKAGVMIRETLGAGSSFAATLLTPGNGSALQVRNGTGTNATHASGPFVAAPYWVKLTRAGNVLTSAVSPDGNTWTTIGSNTVPMAATVYVGLAVTAHDNTQLNASTLDNVTVSAP